MSVNVMFRQRRKISSLVVYRSPGRHEWDAIARRTDEPDHESTQHHRGREQHSTELGRRYEEEEYGEYTRAE